MNNRLHINRLGEVCCDGNHSTVSLCHAPGLNSYAHTRHNASANHNFYYRHKLSTSCWHFSVIKIARIDPGSQQARERNIVARQCGVRHARDG